MFLPENTIPYLLRFVNRQGIKKGRISINIFSLVIILLDVYKRQGDKVYIKVNDTYGYEAEIRSIDKTAKEEEDQLRSY